VYRAIFSCLPVHYFAPAEQPMRPRIAIPLASGYEETEALSPADVLSRAGVEVILCHMPGESPRVKGSHGFILESNTAIDSLDASELTGICIPGGMPGTRNLLQSAPLLELIRSLHKRRAWIAAICAAPIVLHEAGILSGKRITSHPSVQNELIGIEYSERPVVIDEPIISSRGPGTALLFGLTVVAAVKTIAVAVDLAKKMIIDIPPAVMEEWINEVHHSA